MGLSAHSWAQDQMLTRPNHDVRHKRATVMSGVPQRKPSVSSMGNDSRHNFRGTALSVSMKNTTFQRQRGSNSTKQVPMYVNVTGPGDYDIPGFAEQSNMGEPDSNKRTAPSFTLAPKTKQPYFPTYEIDFKGHDSPGMTLYNPRVESIQDKNPVFSIKKDARFTGIEERNRDQLKNIPNQYSNQAFHQNNSFLDGAKGFSMSSGKCWTLHLEKEDETTPGPAYSTQYLNSIARKVDTTVELKQGTFGTFRNRQRTIPNRGLEKAFLGCNSPGPTAYNSAESAKVNAQLSVTKASQKYSMPKVSENFLSLTSLISIRTNAFTSSVSSMGQPHLTTLIQMIWQTSTRLKGMVLTLWEDKSANLTSPSSRRCTTHQSQKATTDEILEYKSSIRRFISH